MDAAVFEANIAQALADENMWEMFNEMKSETDAEAGPSNPLQANHKCKLCGKSDFKTIDGILHCTDCGADNGQVIDTSCEWRYYGHDDNKSSDPTRCGMPIDPRLPHSSMVTMIGIGRGTEHISKIHRWHCSAPYREKSLRNNFEIIKQYCEKLQLNSCVTNYANSIYFAYTSRVTTRGRNHKGTFGACIHISCKRNDVKITPKDICKAIAITTSTLTEITKRIIHIMSGTPFTENIQPTHPRDYLTLFSNKIALPRNVLLVAEQILKIVDDIGIIRQHTAPSIAVGIIFYLIEIIGINISRKYLSVQCDVSEVTISKTANKIKTHKHLILPHISLD